MKFIHPSFEIISYPRDILKNIEKAARTCYKSEDRVCRGSAAKIVEMLLNKKHMAMIEFGGVITVKLKVDRSISHELVRHRLASFAQESQRYIKYKDNIDFIMPPKVKTDGSPNYWIRKVYKITEKVYKHLIELGYSPQEARCVLPNGIATKINIQANIREWLHILELRCSKRAYPPLRKIMLQILNEFYHRTPIIFGNLYKKYEKDM